METNNDFELFYSNLFSEQNAKAVSFKRFIIFAFSFFVKLNDGSVKRADMTLIGLMA